MTNPFRIGDRVAVMMSHRPKATRGYHYGQVIDHQKSHTDEMLQVQFDTCAAEHCSMIHWFVWYAAVAEQEARADEAQKMLRSLENDFCHACDSEQRMTGNPKAQCNAHFWSTK